MKFHNWMANVADYFALFAFIVLIKLFAASYRSRRFDCEFAKLLVWVFIWHVAFCYVANYVIFFSMLTLSFNSFYNAEEDTPTDFIALPTGWVEITKGFVTIDDMPDGTVDGFYWNRLELGLLNGIVSPKEGALTYYLGFYYFF